MGRLGEGGGGGRESRNTRKWSMLGYRKRDEFRPGGPHGSCVPLTLLFHWSLYHSAKIVPVTRSDPLSVEMTSEFAATAVPWESKPKRTTASLVLLTYFVLILGRPRTRSALRLLKSVAMVRKYYKIFCE